MPVSTYHRALWTPSRPEGLTLTAGLFANHNLKAEERVVLTLFQALCPSETQPCKGITQLRSCSAKKRGSDLCFCHLESVSKINTQGYI